MKLLFKLTLILFIFLHLQSVPIYAAVTQDNDAGTYQNDFNTNAGLVTQSGAGINTATGVVQLRNSSNGYTAPYNSSGYIITQTIAPPLLAAWNTLVLSSTIPDNTTIKIQVLDSNSFIIDDEFLPGNSAGFTTSTLDLTSLSPLIFSTDRNTYAKLGGIRLKVTLTTSDNTVSPLIDGLSFGWVLSQGANTASPLAPLSSSWPIAGGNLQNNYQAKTSATSQYYIVNYVSDEYPSIYFQGKMFSKDDEIILQTSHPSGYLYKRNINTGLITSQIPTYMMGWGLITANNNIYITDIVNDTFASINLDSENTNWIYNFYGGHGNSQALVSPDGENIYTIREPSSDSSEFTLYAFKPDGELNWAKTYNCSTDYCTLNEGSVAPNGNIYIASYVFDEEFNYKKESELFVIDGITGSILWTYGPGIFAHPALIDPDGVAYLYEDNWENNTSYDTNVYAINPDGTIKWNHHVDGLTNSGYTAASLRADGNLALLYYNGQPTEYPNYRVDILNSSTGSLINSSPLSSSYGANLKFSDQSNNIVYSCLHYDADYNPLGSVLGTLDINLVNKWQFDLMDGHLMIDNIVPDKNGNIWANILSDYIYEIGANDLKTVRLAPWTASLSVSPSTLKPGSDVTFTAQTSMLQQNPLFDTDNYMQVVLSNGSKIPLSYSHTQGDNTIWTAQAQIPSSLPDGQHTLTLEANAAHIQTDIPLHFDNPAVDSLNTGITATAQITIDNSSPLEDWQDSAGNSKKFRSLGDDNFYTTDDLPQFAFIKSSDNITTVQKYQIILSSKDKKDFVYIDDINPQKPTDKNYRDEVKTYIQYTGLDENSSPDRNYDTITVRSKDNQQKLNTGAYLWRVRAIDQTGNSLDTTPKLILINTYSAFFGKNSKKLVLTSLNNLKLNLNSSSPLPKTINLASDKINLNGIADYPSVIRINLTDSFGKNSIFSVNTDKKSRFNFSQKIIPGSYRLTVSYTDNEGGFIQLPPQPVQIKNKLTFGSYLGVSSDNTKPTPTQKPTSFIEKVISPKIDQKSLDQAKNTLNTIEKIKEYFKKLFKFQ